MTIRCEIVSQDRLVYQGDVDMVVLPGAAGEMGILPHHAPLLTVLNFGIISVKVKGGEQFFTVAGGVAEVQPDQVTVLADAAENVEEIDEERALQAQQRAEGLDARGSGLSGGAAKGAEQLSPIQTDEGGDHPAQLGARSNGARWLGDA